MSTKGHILIWRWDGNPQAIAVDQDDYVTADSGELELNGLLLLRRCSQWFNWCYYLVVGESRNLTIDDLSTLLPFYDAENSKHFSGSTMKPLIILMAVI